MSEEIMVVMNCGTQGMNKFRMQGRTVLEKKTFPPFVAVECSREMGEALLKKHSNPNMAIFFRNPADKKHIAEIENNFMPNIGAAAKARKEAASNNAGAVEKSAKRKYVRRK